MDEKILNQNQRKAATHTYGPALVIAGPGTGKTQTLATRVGFLVSSTLMVNPNEILCLTFTEAGVAAMRKRIIELVGVEGHKVAVHTFHSFCNNIIQNYPDFFGVRDFKPVSDLEQIRILTQIVDELPLDNPLKRIKGDVYFEVTRLKNLFKMMKEEAWIPAEMIKNIISYLTTIEQREEFIYKKANKNKGVVAGDVKKDAVIAMTEKMEKLSSACVLFDKYNDILREQRRYDFSDMIHWILRGWGESVGFLRNFQERHQWIMVDEYQDTNASQNLLVDMLLSAWDSPNIMVIGDDDQGIYEFQGARIKNIFAFIDKYNPEIICLTENYRSYSEILSFSSHVIENNTIRIADETFQKQLTAHNGSENVNVSVFEAGSLMEEDIFILDAIDELRENGTNLNDIAILFRKNKQAVNIFNLLRSNNIPCYVKRRKDIFESVIIRWIFIMLKMFRENLRGNYDTPSLLKIIHMPFWNLDSKTVFDTYVEFSKKFQRKEDFKFSDAEEAIQCVIDKLSLFRSAFGCKSFSFAFETMIVESGLLDWAIRDKEGDNLFALRTLWDFILEEEEKNIMMDIESFVDLIDKMLQNDIGIPEGVYEYERQGITLSTCHGAKGLEWDHVFLMGATKNEWESSRSSVDTYTFPDTIIPTSEEDTLESNRRLFYVACTRAKKSLTITYAKENASGKPLERSLFVDEGIESLAADVKEATVYDNRYAVIPATTKDTLINNESTKLYAFEKERIESYALSPTDIIAFNHCSLQFYYEKFLKLPVGYNEAATYGTVVHEALELFYGKKSDDVIETFIKRMNVHKNKFNKFEEWLHIGQKHLREYSEKIINNWDVNVIRTEYALRGVTINDVPCKGIVDRIDKMDEYFVRIVDYKTGTESSFKSKMKQGGDYWLAGVFYDLLVRNMTYFDWVPSEICFSHISGNPVNQVLSITEEDRLTVMSLIKETYNKIINKQFDTRCNECFWCQCEKIKKHGN